jgi:hypothetical protein
MTGEAEKGGGVRGQIIRPQERLVPYKSFNTLWLYVLVEYISQLVEKFHSHFLIFIRTKPWLISKKTCQNFELDLNVHLSDHPCFLERLAHSYCTVAPVQKGLNDLKRAKLSSGRMIRLHAHPPPPSPVSKLED